MSEDAEGFTPPAGITGKNAAERIQLSQDKLHAQLDTTVKAEQRREAESAARTEERAAAERLQALANSGVKADDE